jgi:hypothetical protein
MMRHFPRIAGIVLIAAAVSMSVQLVRQMQEPDFGEPPIGALCMAVPIVILLISAGAVWTAGKSRPPGSRGDDAGLR